MSGARRTHFVDLTATLMGDPSSRAPTRSPTIEEMLYSHHSEGFTGKWERRHAPPRVYAPIPPPRPIARERIRQALAEGAEAARKFRERMSRECVSRGIVV